MTRAAPIARERRPIPLALILGRSPQNCRRAATDDDVAGLVASIAALAERTGEGLIQPLIVSPAPGPALAFHVHDGGRRLAALRALVEAGTFRADRPIDCLVLAGQGADSDETIAREVSLFANTLRRDLHPVEQCDAFEALRAAGVEPERIAADFALPLRQVRQRLRLTRLSPAVRAAWRDGRLSTEQAQAFAVSDSHEAQDAMLARFGDRPCHWASIHIRADLMEAAKALSFDTREAKYLGPDAYVAAGGRVEEDLFADAPVIFDEALLKRLARNKMMAAGDAILAAEGYGFCFAMDDFGHAYHSWDRIAPDYAKAEEARLEAIEDEGQALADDERAQIDALEAEEEAIHARAYERAATPEQRARAGILVAIDHEGALVVERGLFAPPAVKAAPPTSDAPRADTPTPAETSRAKTPKPADPIEAAASGLGMIRTILDETATKALVAVVTVRPDLALMYAVARFGGSYAPDRLEREFGIAPERFGGPSKREGVLGRLDGVPFDAAIALCTDVPLADLTVTFAAITARSIRLSRLATVAGLEPIMRAFGRRGAGLGPAFRTAFDADRYFEAATRAACLAALEAMSTDNVDRGAKKPVLAALAAADAKTKGWLPYPLADWAAIDADSAEADDEPRTSAPPLAQAMSEAIEADDVSRIVAMLVFLTIHLKESAGDFIWNADLYAAYRDAVDEPFGEGRFIDELFELGCLDPDGKSVGDLAFIRAGRNVEADAAAGRTDA